MVSVGYGQQLTQLKGGNIRLKAMYITEKYPLWKARRREAPCQHLLESLTRAEKYNFFLQG
jgi:hypothetical protein